MSRFELCLRGLAALLLVVALPAGAQSFRVQCPTSTITHPNAASNNLETPYTAPTTLTCSVANGCGGSAGNVGYWVPSATSATNGAIKCQQVTGGDGYATMADGTQIYLFAFAPASGLSNIINGLPGTTFPSDFDTMFGVNQTFPYSPTGSVLLPGDPATTMNQGTAFTFNGAVGIAPSVSQLFTVYDISEGVYPACTPPILQPGQTLPTPPLPPAAVAGAAPGTIGANVVTVVLNAASPFQAGDTVVISGTGNAHYDGTQVVTAAGLYNWCYTQSSVNATQYPNGSAYAFTFTAGATGQAQITGSATAVATAPAGTDKGHIDARQLMDVSVMNGNQPAPLMAIDEDDEFFLTLSNVGMIMRPDLFEQHTIHFHGYPNASAFYDGVPDASVAISIGASFSYYYLAPDAGTYFFHCHITPPEHLQMGMVGQLYVRPRQNRVPLTTALYGSLVAQQGDLRTACNPVADFACSNNLPAVNTGATQGLDKLGQPQKYVYNDGDGSTAYDVEYPIQMMGFDPNFHFVGMTFNGEGFADMKDKYFLLNGRSYPDTVGGYTCGANDPFAGCTVNGVAVPTGTIVPGPMQTPSSDGVFHFSQPLPSVINIPAGGRALLRISQLSVAEYMTLQSVGIPMTVVGYNAKLLRDQAGINLSYLTNSITLGGGESLDVILDASDTTKYQAGQRFFVYSANLDELSNDAENFGGLMTEVHICNRVTGPTFGNQCL
ncbi:MAG TPA: multicopper oxidase domain-containing protein [Burkholderiaceae bacterium]|nr:multicopper oxidase domain-containing protein [Burkholderiaceae bacterium]